MHTSAYMRTCVRAYVRTCMISCGNNSVAGDGGEVVRGGFNGRRKDGETTQ